MSRLRHALLILGALLALPPGLSAQQVPDSVPPRSGLPLHRALVDLERVEKGTATAAEAERVERGPRLVRRDDGAVQVEIVGPPGTTLPEAFSADSRLEQLTRFSNASEAWIRLEDLAEVAASLPPGHTIYPGGDFLAGEDAIEGQGPDVTRSGAYRDVGFDGSGLTIAVIDGSWNGFYDSLDAGEIPPFSQMTIFNLSGSTFTSGDSKHGVGCLETVYDHAPGAYYLVYKAGSAAALGQAVDSAILLGADIITHSMSRYNYGWNDDEGAPCDAANLAAEEGILFFTSAGNRAQTHWQGDYSTPDGDVWHNWSGNDETINVTIPSDSTARIYLSWDTSGGVHDYDLYLYNDDLSQILAVSDNVGEGYEAIVYENDGFQGIDVHIAVRRQSGNGTALELFQHGGGVWDEHAVALSSTTSPSNSTHPNVISVGAVRWQDYDEPPGTFNIVTSYSSLGPSNNLMTTPDVCGPTSTSGYAYGVFSGTSCATPNAAGAAAVLWSCNPNVPVSTVRNELFDFANIRDWAFDGKDIFYGEGGLILPFFRDCNNDGDPDACDILNGASDANDNGRIDFCEESGFNIGFQAPAPPWDPAIGLIVLAVSVVASEIPDPGQPLSEVNGFFLNLMWDEPDLVVTSVQPSPVLEEIGGGVGPSFFNAVQIGNGLFVECIFDSAAFWTLQFGTETPLFEFETELVALSLSSDPILFDLDPSAGNFFQLAPSGTAVPSSTGAFATPEPLERFQMKIDDLTRSYDPTEDVQTAVVRPELSQISGALDPSTAFVFWLRNDLLEIQPQSLTTLSPLNDLNGGLGPDFFDHEIGPASVGVACVYSFQGAETIPLQDPMRPVAISYATVPGVLQGNLVGMNSRINWSETADNTISSSTGVNDAVTVGGWITFLPVIEEEFIRGDFDGSGSLGLEDAIQLLDYLFSGGDDPPCPDAADVNDDGVLGIADSIALLTYLFAGGDDPPAPGPLFCGVDPTLDALGPCAPGVCPTPPEVGQED